MNKESKKPWSTKAVMEQIYEKKLWGGNNFDYYSGYGSHELHIISPYLEVVTVFLNSFNPYLSVSDLGCGDFNVGKELLNYSQEFHAVDIVENLIKRNQEKYQDKKVTFHCLDIAEDSLPYADCVILRQVLQHLSNSEVQKILNKLAGFKYLILTEHVPKGDFVPNLDVISGQGIRLKKKSAINILQPPFNFKVKEEKELLSIDLGLKNGLIVTKLFTLH